MRRRGWGTRDLRVLVALQLAVLLPLLVVGLLLDAGFVQRQATQTLRSASGRATAITSLVLQPALGRADLGAASPVAVQDTLAAALAQPAVQQDTVRIEVWDPDGRIVASDDPALLGRTFPLDTDLRGALAGSTVAHVTVLDAADDIDDHGPGRTVEVYVPVRAGTTITGVFELYLPYEPFATAAQHDATVAGRDLGIALGLLAVVFSVVLWSVVGRLGGQARAAAAASQTDALTGLPNRLGLEAELAARIARGEEFVLAVADVQGLGEVNEALGYEGGDALLTRIASVLADPESGRFAARIGGDEFGVLMPGTDPGTALPRLRATAAQEYEVAGVPVTPLLSIGAVAHPAHSSSVRELLAMATAAQSAAGRLPGGIGTYDPVLDPYDAGNLRLLTELRRAIASEQLVLQYQPQAAVVDGRIVGVEALVRWEHPRRGLLLPAEFLPIAEKTGLVVDITRWVLRAAAVQAASWRARGGTPTVSVNISARDLADPTFAAEAELIVGAAGAKPGWICLELTETALVDDRAGARDVLQALAAAGFRLSLDDFGQGFTSLGQLRELPLHELKLDRAFVEGMDRNAADAAIVSGIASLTHNLGLTLVAEGVEHPEQLALLRAAGYDIAQGWHIGRPVHAESLTPRLLLPRQPGTRRGPSESVGAGVGGDPATPARPEDPAAAGT